MFLDILNPSKFAVTVGGVLLILSLVTFIYFMVFAVYNFKMFKKTEDKEEKNKYKKTFIWYLIVGIVLTAFLFFLAMLFEIGLLGGRTGGGGITRINYD